MNEDLINAAMRGDIEQAKCLIARGADVNGSGFDSDYPSALEFAVYKGNRAMVDFLLQAGADVNRRSEYTGGDTPLMVAVSEGQVEIARVLIAHGADVNARVGENNNGDSVLTIAKSQKAPYKQEFTTLLKQAGAKE